MNKFNITSAKYVSIIIGICLVFMLAVWHAFDYLPTEVAEKYLSDLESNHLVNEIKEVEIIKEETVSKDSEELFEKVYDDSSDIIIDLEKVLQEARNLAKNNLYKDSVALYQKIISDTDNATVLATCYEEVGLIYAVAKKYELALKAIQQSYKLEPSLSREILLARLYYKTNDFENAKLRMGNILKRDFDIND